MKTYLIDLIKDHALQRGHFVLSSGKESNYYLDCRKLTLSWQGAREVSTQIANLIFRKFPKADTIAGPTPIIGSILIISHLNGLIVRKESKDHGTRSLIEGPLKANNKIVVIEDVCTTGESALKVIKVLREAGTTVLGVICVIDREEGAKKLLFKNDIKEFYSLVTLSELGL